MSSRPADLPDFDNPPVSEVALAVRFEPIGKLQTHHLGAIAAIFERDYPLVQERPPGQMPIEVFGAESAGQRAIQVEIIGGHPLPRLWFLKADESALLQFEPSFFAANWRKRGSGAQYPRYESIVEAFENSLAALARFVADRQLGDIRPQQCEVTYVNQIKLPDGAPGFKAPDRVFAHWTAWPPSPALPELEDCGFISRFRLVDEEGAPFARLITNAQPWTSPNEGPTMQFVLSVRGRPSEPSIASTRAFLDMGRAAIVRAFAAMTRDEMHKFWGRKQ